jgi:PAS domain S-box-containing protein
MPVQKEEAIRLRDTVLKDIHPSHHFNRLFDTLHDTGFFVKDREGRFLFVNKFFLEYWSYEKEEDFIGKTDADFLPKKLTDKYRRDDLRVMRTKKPYLNIFEIILLPNGKPAWYVTNKMPVISKNGEVIGVMGVLRRFETVQQIQASYPTINNAIEYLKKHYTENISIQELAEIANISIRQLQRYFKQYFDTTPQQFLIKLRIYEACRLLRQQKVQLSRVAQDLGFYDQSSFTRHFKKSMGMTPRQSRKMDLVSFPY